MKSSETRKCSSLMRALIHALERYDALLTHLTGEEKISLDTLREVLARRKALLREIEPLISELEPFSVFLEGTEDKTLLRLKQRVSELQALTRRHDILLVENLKTQRDRLAAQLEALNHAGRAMRSYGRQPHLPPRFLDSLN